MCGLSGYNGSKPAPLDKMKILGLYNISRGKHSCGYYYDGTLRHGIDATKEWDDFITDGELVNNEGSKGAKSFIGHTRSATKGAVNSANAHPFIVDGLVQIHNGTLENSFVLCNKYDINCKEIHVDSLALAHLIRKKGWSILDEYVGYAANMWIFEDEPDSLYVYHGASRTKRDDEKSYEERPMFYMEGKSCVYFSSLKESLMAIRDTRKQKPSVLPHNAVYKFTNGKLDKIVYKVKREDNNLDFLSPVKAVAPVVGFRRMRDYPPTSAQGSSFGDVGAPIAFSLISREREPVEANITNRVYHQKGRFWYKTKIGDKISIKLMEGKYRIARGGDIMSINGKHERQIDECYFIQGVLLNKAKDYKRIIALQNVAGHALSSSEIIKQNFAYYISKYSRYPVTCLTHEGLEVADDIRYRWYYQEKVYSGTATPRFTSRRYEIHKGRLCKILHDKGDLVYSQKVLEQDQPKPLYTPLEITFPTAKVSNSFINNLEQSEEYKIMSYFNQIWINLSELEDLPPAVYGAIEAYVDDFLEDRDLSEITIVEKNEYYQEFLKDCIDNRYTFYENMDKEYQGNVQYYVQIALKQLKEGPVQQLKCLPPADDKYTQYSEKTYNLQKAKDLLDKAMNEMDDDIPPVDDASINAMIEEHYKNQEGDPFVIDTQVETEEARRQFDEIIDTVIQLRKFGDKMQRCELSDLAQEIAFCVYNTVDNFKLACVNHLKDKTLKAKLEHIDNPF